MNQALGCRGTAGEAVHPNRLLARVGRDLPVTPQRLLRRCRGVEACARLEPENMPRHQILAELYQMQGPEAYDKAVRQWRVILKHTQDIAAMVPILKTLRTSLPRWASTTRSGAQPRRSPICARPIPRSLRFHEQYS